MNRRFRTKPGRSCVGCGSSGEPSIRRSKAANRCATHAHQAVRASRDPGAARRGEALSGDAVCGPEASGTWVWANARRIEPYNDAAKLRISRIVDGARSGPAASPGCHAACAAWNEGRPEMSPSQARRGTLGYVGSLRRTLDPARPNRFMIELGPRTHWPRPDRPHGKCDGVALAMAGSSTVECHISLLAIAAR